MLRQREKLRESAYVCVCDKDSVKEHKMKVKNNRRLSGKYYDKSLVCKIIK